MHISHDQWIGSIGVALLLVAYGLNLRGVLNRESKLYQALNVLGAGLACLASWMIEYFPFVVLEGFWMAVSLVALLKKKDPAA